MIALLISKGRCLMDEHFPPPPVNVRVVYPGEVAEVPVDCVYVGTQRARGPRGLVQLHVWEVINHRSELPIQVHVQRLPARTSIRIGGDDWLPGG